MSQPSKKFKSGSSSDRELASPLNTPSSSPIFRLNVDCCEEIFDFLSLKDLYAIGQTCKRMQSIAGYCFQQNYSHQFVDCSDDGIYMNDVRINDFTRFVQCVQICPHLRSFHYIKSNQFDSLRRINLCCENLTDEKIAIMKEFLSKIEIIYIVYCTLNGDFYEQILKFCPNLKELFVSKDSNANPLIGNGNTWLLKKYPNLQDFAFCGSQSAAVKINELKVFLKNNSSIKHLFIDVQFIMLNTHSLIDADFKVDTLVIDHKPGEIHDVREILNELWKKGSFKKLNLKRFGDKDLVNEIDLLPPINKLTISFISEDIAWQRLTELKELNIFREIKSFVDIEKMAKNLIHTEKIFLANAKINQIFAFVRYSPKITEINVRTCTETDDELRKINAQEWNNERKKLAGARKVVINIDEAVYLASKWKENDTDQSLVQIKRLNR